jgi:formylmethanofuran dehydrogenase subunit C
VNRITLTWRPRTGPQPIDGSCLRPDTLGAMNRAALVAQTLRIGRDVVPLSECFDITHEALAESHAQPTLIIRAAPPLDRLGELMQHGSLIIEGDAGDDLGASMHDGLIRVTGSAGHRVGGPAPTRDRGMTGGEILVHGSAGDRVGLLMRRGLIVIAGPVGQSPGYRTLAGTIALLQGPFDHPALHNRRGSLLLLDKTNQLPTLAYAIKQDTFPVSAIPTLGLLLRRIAQLGIALPDGVLQGQFTLSSVDRTELGRGEIWQWVN